ncbi:MAG TPA: ATP-binding cassette domain-containing protein [Candidatus Acidoferrum sp.]|nr:ATP-binding cassette domain-containing protein [Candidatus Acidoferrum sp.]
MEPLLRVENLEKRYERGSLFRAGKSSRVTALAGVSFVICPKTTLALVGGSGSGKSTLALCVACLETPTSGSIHLESNEITGLKEKELRAVRPQIQLVFQNPASSLNPRLTVLDIVTEPLDVQGLFSEREKGEKARELLDRVGLPREKVLRRPDELSVGQKQRVAIARALVLNPKLLILDEALSALDCSIQAQVANLLLELQASLGCTYLFITHDFRMAVHLADEIAVMEQGQIVEFGKAEGVFRSPKHLITRQMVNASMGISVTPRPPEAL